MKFKTCSGPAGLSDCELSAAHRLVCAVQAAISEQSARAGAGLKGEMAAGSKGS